MASFPNEIDYAFERFGVLPSVLAGAFLAILLAAFTVLTDLAVLAYIGLASLTLPWFRRVVSALKTEFSFSSLKQIAYGPFGLFLLTASIMLFFLTNA